MSDFYSRAYRLPARPSSVDKNAQDVQQELFQYSDLDGDHPYVRPRSGFGFKLPVTSSVPTHEGVAGEVWVLEDSDLLYVYTGTSWRSVVLS